MNYKLSFCIPTYNREPFLVELLDGINDQISDKIRNQIEIVISDNASTDNTKSMVESYQNKFPELQLHYYCNETNIGFDKNILKVVDLAQGEYCWLMGSDDKPVEGSLQKIYAELNKNPEIDIYISNRIDCDLHLKPQSTTIWRDEKEHEGVYNLSKREDLIQYLEGSSSVGLFFGYISNLIIKKEKWDNVPYKEVFTGTGFSYSYKVLAMKDFDCKLKYLKDPLVYCRWDNDTTFNPDNNYMKRILIEYNGYLLLADEAFANDQKLRKAFLQTRLCDLGYKALIYLRLNHNIQEWNHLEKRLVRYPYNKAILLLIKYGKPIFVIAKLSIRSIKKLKKHINKPQTATY